MSALQRIAETSRSLETTRAGNEFCELARGLMNSRGDLTTFRAKAEAGRAPERIREVLKSAISAGTLEPSNWAGPLGPIGPLNSAFLDSLRSVGCFDLIMANGAKVVPLRTRVAITVAGLSGSIVPGASVKPLSALTLGSAELTELKAVALFIASEELVDLGGSVAARLFATELRGAVARVTDDEFISILLAAATPVTTNGGTSTAILQDIAALFAAVNTSASSRLFLIVDSPIAKFWSAKVTSDGALAFPAMTPSGGRLCGVDVIVADAADGRVILVDASQLAVGAGGVTPRVTKYSTVAMSDAPDSPATASTTLLPLWQHNLVGLLAERLFGCEVLGDSAVAYAEVSYSGNSPA